MDDDGLIPLAGEERAVLPRPIFKGDLIPIPEGYVEVPVDDDRVPEWAKKLVKEFDATVFVQEDS